MPKAVELLDLNTAPEFLEALNLWKKPWDAAPQTWMFRGQHDATWDLVPSALRNEAGEYINLRKFHQGSTPVKAPSTLPLTSDQAKEVMEVEWSLVKDFYEGADQCAFHIPEDCQRIRQGNFESYSIGPCMTRCAEGSYEWPHQDLLSLFALAQHYGVPTRLLDWTKKPRFAAYFAGEQVVRKPPIDPNAKLAVWALREDIVRDMGRPAAHPQIKIITAPMATNPNLAAQDGRFTIDSNVLMPQPLNKLIEGLITTATKSNPGHSIPLPVLVKLTLPHTEAPALMRLLAVNERISTATVYPGLQGVAQSLKDRRHWDR